MAGKDVGRAAMYCWSPVPGMVQEHFFRDNQTYANQIGIGQ